MSKTWLINNTINTVGVTQDIDFISNDIQFVSFAVTGAGSNPTVSYTRADGDLFPPVYRSNAWTNQAYRTVTFETAPTGDLLTWLEANAVKQISGYSITYHANGGTPTPEDLTGQTSLPNPLPVVSKEGFSFEGWYLDSTFETPAVAGATIDEDTNLYAKWKVAYDTLSDLFTGIADSIRNKKGTSNPIVATDFPSEIDSIELPSASGEEF